MWLHTRYSSVSHHSCGSFSCGRTHKTKCGSTRSLNSNTHMQIYSRSCNLWLSLQRGKVHARASGGNGHCCRSGSRWGWDPLRVENFPKYLLGQRSARHCVDRGGGLGFSQATMKSPAPTTHATRTYSASVTPIRMPDRHFREAAQHFTQSSSRHAHDACEVASCP